MKKIILNLTLLASIGSTMAFTSNLTAQADTLYVNIEASGNEDGSDWANAYTDLQDALGTAISGDQIWVAKGKYLPTKTTDTTASFTLLEGVKIYGGFSGGEDNIEIRNFSDNETILSGDIGVVGDSLDNVTNVVVINTVSSNSTLDGFTVQDGFGYNGVFSSRQNNSGSGIYVAQSSVVLKNLIVKNNTAVYGGGIIITNGSSPILENIITENNYGRWGGGLSFNKNFPTDTVKVTNIVSRNNKALSGTGIYCKDARNYMLTDVKVYDNDGDGIEFYRPNSGSFANVTVSNNKGVGIKIFTSYGNATDKVIVKNALVHNNGTNAVSIQSNSAPSTVLFYNATIVGKTLIYETLDDKVIFVNSILSGTVTNSTQNSTIFSYCVAPSGLAKDGGNNKFDVSPIFADSINLDFRIRENSPARDNALDTVITYLSTKDVLGNPRVENGKLDIGAIEYDIALGIFGNKTQNNTVAFPNPFENDFTIEVQMNSTISVYNSEGALVDSIESGSGNVSIDGSSYASGLYHVVILNSAGKQHTTLMKK